MKGLLLIDKPAGMTSHDVVDCVRKAAKMRRIGHTGTLDPSATGLLLICVGAATRLSEHLTGMDKTYEGNMRFGVVTDSYDMDGKVLEEHTVPELDFDTVQHTFAQFQGAIDQIPPMVSAVKIGGERLYKKARKGEVVDRPPRRVKVDEFSLLKIALPLADFRVRCGSGTYVRALCHDVGQVLGCGAALNQLRRTVIGRYSVSDAAALDELQSPDDIEKRLIPLGEALDMPAVIVESRGRKRIQTGNAVPATELLSEIPVKTGWVQMKSEDSELLALGQVEPGATGFQVQPRRVFIAQE
ncbi:MAG: tRNA pseudouridine(55) synthase TruB [Candidatus Hydrogenedentota bacterium]|nr:MAG: tRNA pseudouridine(55) synthase TruB [Candidatus Hydrogenedentota bacterium]